MCGIPYYLSGAGRRADSVAGLPAGVLPRAAPDRPPPACPGHQRSTPERHVIRYREGGRDTRLGYHRLVVAAGGTPTLPPVPGLDDPRVFGVRTLEDAIGLRSLLDAGRIGRALVVGGGYIGLEMVEALIARGVAVIQAELLPRVMPNLDPPVAALVEEEVRRHGVDLRLGARLARGAPHRRGTWRR